MSDLTYFRFISLIVAIALTSPVYAQFFDKEDWRDNRSQLTIGVGACNFLGDLGGKDAIGTDDFQDLELSETRFAAFIGYKYTVYKKIHLRGEFTYGQVQGADNLTEEPFRQNRNLSFRSNIFELAVMAEIELPINKRKGHIYDIKGARGWRYKGSSFYLFGGIGGLYFNPRTQLDGRWIDLQPLRTEGQGLPGGPDEYRRVALCIPVGLAYSMRLSDTFSIGLEASYRFTFTDYIDDVSTEYYDPNDISLYVGGDQGELAAYLSNPALGPAQGGLSSRVTSPGMQRGDPTDDDGYMFVWLKTHILLKERDGFNASKRRYKPARRRKSKKIIF